MFRAIFCTLQEGGGAINPVFTWLNNIFYKHTYIHCSFMYQCIYILFPIRIKLIYFTQCYSTQISLQENNIQRNRLVLHRYISQPNKSSHRTNAKNPKLCENLLSYFVNFFTNLILMRNFVKKRKMPQVSVKMRKCHETKMQNVHPKKGGHFRSFCFKTD